MKVLLIYQTVPEDTKFYLIKDPTEEQLRMLKEANNKFVNSDELNDAMIYLSEALMPIKYKRDRDVLEQSIFKDSLCIWTDKEVKAPIEGPIDKVFISGFVL